MDKSSILEEIEAAFPFVEMPSEGELTFHLNGCRDCDDVREELEYYRGKEITGKAIRAAHRYLSVLTSKATRWILPHYLRFCFTAEAEHNRMETESLIYSLGPGPGGTEVLDAQVQRLSMLNADQITCLIHFLEWCLGDEYWSRYCPEDIESGLGFLADVLRRRSVT
jgi:hypothetical protein